MAGNYIRKFLFDILHIAQSIAPLNYIKPLDSKHLREIQLAGTSQ